MHLLSARRVVAAFLGAGEERTVFTSGGTEGNNTVLSRATAAGAVHHMLTTAIEHPSVLRPMAELAQSGIDFLAFSGRKLHGPRGIDVLYVRDPKILVPLLRGGDQEAGRRARTENLPGVVGLAGAYEIRVAEFGAAVTRMRALRDRFERKILADVGDVRVNGAAAPRVCNTTSIRFGGVDG